jgi:hypothetical protein
LPSNARQAVSDFAARSTLSDAAPPWSGAARVHPRLVAREPAASTLVRPAHKLHCVFDVPPGFGEFELALRFKVDRVPGSFCDGLGAVRFQQLSRIVVDFDFSHGVTLLSLRATVNFSRAAEP